MKGITNKKKSWIIKHTQIRRHYGPDGHRDNGEHQKPSATEAWALRGVAQALSWRGSTWICHWYKGGNKIDTSILQYLRGLVGLCKTYYGMFRRRAEGKEKEWSRWIREEEGWENGGGWVKGAHYTWAGHCACLTAPCIRSMQSSLPSY